MADMVIRWITLLTTSVNIRYVYVICVGVELQTKALSVYVAWSLGLHTYYYIPSCECSVIVNANKLWALSIMFTSSPPCCQCSSSLIWWPLFHWPLSANAGQDWCTFSANVCTDRNCIWKLTACILLILSGRACISYNLHKLFAHVFIIFYAWFQQNDFSPLAYHMCIYHIFAFSFFMMYFTGISMDS